MLFYLRIAMHLLKVYGVSSRGSVLATSRRQLIIRFSEDRAKYRKIDAKN